MAVNGLPVNIDHSNAIEHKAYVSDQGIDDQGDTPGRQEPSRRTHEIEEFTNLHFIHPIAAWLTPFLARMRVSPNAVSITGMGCGLLAGWAYYRFDDIRYAVGGFVLMLVWHILDGVDGQLARLTNRQSEFGKIIDGLADNITFGAVYIGLGLALSRSGGAWVWPLIGVAAVAHSLQAATYELQRQEYEFWGRDRKSAEFKSVATLSVENAHRTLIQRMFYALGQQYARTQRVAAQVDDQYRDKIASTLAAHPDRAQAIRCRYREMFSSSVRTWSVCSSNYRTFLIFLSAAFGLPQIYFLTEILVLTPLSMLMVKQQKIKSREFSHFLDQQA